MNAKAKSVAGFTMLELMITLAVAGVLAAVAIPNMRDFIRNNRLTAGVNDMLRSTQIARSEAIKRQAVVAVCASADPFADPGALACSNGAFSGWFVFQDTNSNWAFDDPGDAVIERKSVATGVTVRNNNNGVISYSGTGLATSTPGQTATNRILLCDERGLQAFGDNSTGRAVIIETSGRSRTTRHADEVDQVLTNLGGTCP